MKKSIASLLVAALLISIPGPAVQTALAQSVQAAHVSNAVVGGMPVGVAGVQLKTFDATKPGANLSLAVLPTLNDSPKLVVPAASVLSAAKGTEATAALPAAVLQEHHDLGKRYAELSTYMEEAQKADSTWDGAMASTQKELLAIAARVKELETLQPSLRENAPGTMKRLFASIKTFVNARRAVEDPSGAFDNAAQEKKAEAVRLEGEFRSALSRVQGLTETNGTPDAKDIAAVRDLPARIERLKAAPAAVTGAVEAKSSWSSAIGRVAWGATFGVALKSMIGGIFVGLAVGPTTIAFKVFAGSLLFWSILGSIVLHEMGHAWTAEKLGDITPRNSGQLTPNPLRFTGPIGATILLVTGLMGFPAGGFATNPQQSFDSPENRKATGLVAVAGPLVNLAIGLLSVGLIVGLKTFAPGLVAMPWIGGTLRILVMNAIMNFALMLFNLIPFGPLDGQKVLTGLVPEKWHKIIEKVTMWTGILLLGGITIYYLGMSAHTAVTQGGAGTPFGNTGSAFVMAVTANGVALWLGAVWPAIRDFYRGIVERVKEAKILAKGGVALNVTIPMMLGKAPMGVNVPMRFAIPWSWKEGGMTREELSKNDYLVAGVPDLLALPAEQRRVLRATDGEALALDDKFVEDVRVGRLLLLVAKDRSFHIAVPSDVLGGTAEVLELVETGWLASMGDGRRLLKPAEMKLVIGLSKLVGTPIYEMGFAPDAEHPSLARYARTEHGMAFFLREDVIAAVAAAPEKERAEMTSALQAYLLLMILSQTEGPGKLTWIEAEQSFFRSHPAFRAWAAPERLSAPVVVEASAR